MIKPSHKHTNSLMQSIRLLENAKRSAIEPKFIKALDRDIKLHEQVREMLYHWIENPTLPFLDDRKGHDPDFIKFVSMPVKQLLDDIDNVAADAF